MKAFLHCPMVDAKTLKLRFRVGDLDLPQRRTRYTINCSREEEDAQLCPRGKENESRAHIVGYFEIYKGERDVLEVRQIDECDMEKFNAVPGR